MEIKEIEKQEAEILDQARQAGVSENYLFATTFERYSTLIRMCASLKEEFEKADVVVSKEYVKGRENVVLHPALRAYNTTAATANKTAESLMKLINAFDIKDGQHGKSKLMRALNGELDDDPYLRLING